MYNGLTTADKGALLDAKADGWDDYIIRGELVNIDLALAQIAEMELTTNSMPLTWNERINQMTVEEKAEHMSRWLGCYGCPFDMDCGGDCKMALQNYLNSPYTEGANK